jgi:recombination protein RecT
MTIETAATGLTVGQAVDQVSAAPKMISPEVFGQVLPKHLPPERFTRWALTLLKRDDLARVAQTDAGRLSIMSALMDCASLGLEPGRTYHLVPFGTEVTGITDYKGEVELIWRAVQRPVIAQLVHAKDSLILTGANIPPAHEADWFGDRGPVAGGYAYVDYGNGLYSLVIRMSEADFLHHRDKAKTKTVWDEWPESMRLKTLVHQLRKWVPWSADQNG